MQSAPPANPAKLTPATQFARLGIILFALLLALTIRAQVNSGSTHPMLPQPIGQGVAGPSDIPGGNPDLDQEKVLRTLNAERQKSLVADTNKLLRLAKQFNDEIAHTNPDQLTPEQIRQLAAIEKLAHSVKEKMSTSVRGTPAFQPPMQPIP
jgi:hypothetical protein